MGMGQRRTTEITRGLFAVRYVGADDSAQPPRVKISAEPELRGLRGCDPAPRSRRGRALTTGNLPDCAGDASWSVGDRSGAEPNQRLNSGHRQHRAVDPGRSRVYLQAVHNDRR